MQKALFLDRDGVINIEKNYLYKIEDFEFIDGIIPLCREFLGCGYIIIVVTNQSGIARGYYSEDDFKNLTLWMVNEFLKNGIEIKKVYYCPHHPTINGKCECRKPESGMFLQARDEFNIDMKSSVMIGDKITDIDAALNAGVCVIYLFDESKTLSYEKATKVVSTLEEIKC
jgi:D-glycero-D-manno-heptose 1,7-bisphosphate phosphatase